MKKLLPLALLVNVLLSGCVVVPDYYPVGGVVVRDSGPPHCPPGQAKKGRC